MYFPQKKSNKDDIIDEQRVLANERNLDHETLEHKKRILNYLRVVPASYLSEMAWETTISEYTLKNTIAIMQQEGLVESIRVNPDQPDIRLMARVPDQSAIGQAGTFNFSKKRWFAITEEGRKHVF